MIRVKNSQSHLLIETGTDQVEVLGSRQRRSFKKKIMDHQLPIASRPRVDVIPREI